MDNLNFRLRDIARPVDQNTNSEQYRADFRARLRQSPLIITVLFMCAILAIVVVLLTR